MHPADDLSDEAVCVMLEFEELTAHMSPFERAAVARELSLELSVVANVEVGEACERN